LAIEVRLLTQSLFVYWDFKTDLVNNVNKIFELYFCYRLSVFYLLKLQ